MAAMAFIGCDGRSDEYYWYTRLRQPNDTSTGHVWEYGERFAKVWVNIVSTPAEDIVSTPSEELGSTTSEDFGSTSASSG
jgi:hypothetical protein